MSKPAEFGFNVRLRRNFLLGRIQKGIQSKWLSRRETTIPHSALSPSPHSITDDQLPIPYTK